MSRLDSFSSLRAWDDELQRAKREGTEADAQRVEHERQKAAEEKDRLDRFRKNLGLSSGSTSSCPRS